MPKFDIANQQLLKDFQIPNPPLTLQDCKSDEDIELYIKQELKKISETNDSYMKKEMKKEDLYWDVAPKIKNSSLFL